MSLRSNNPGIHFKDPWLMEPHTESAAQLQFYDKTPTARISNTTAFFTGFAQYGIQDNTDWSSNTYKTIYSHTGTGLVFAMIACTAGGAETTTFEITIDGVLSTITITNASGERAYLSAAGHGGVNDEFTVSGEWLAPRATVIMDSSTLTTWQTSASGTFMINPKWAANAGVPALRYNISCLIRMKHSASITNSTATAYSGVLVRKGIAA